MAWRFIPSAAAGIAVVAFVAAVLSVSTPAQAQYTGCYAGTTVLCDTKIDTWCSVWAEPDLTIGTSTKTGGRLCMREISTTYYYYLNTWPTGPGGTGGGTGGTGGSGGSGGAGGSESDDCGNPDLWYDDGANCRSGGNYAH